MEALIVFIILLLGIAIALVVYNINLKKKLHVLDNTNQKVTSLSVLQDFMNTVSEQITADENIQLLLYLMVQNMKLKHQMLNRNIGKHYEICRKKKFLRIAFKQQPQNI